MPSDSLIPKKALVIDDGPVERAILGKILQGLGYQVIEAVDGKAGLLLVVGQSPFPVIFVDWNMPNLDGMGFLKGVRASSSNGKSRLVMVTGETSLAKVRSALAAGADEYLMKPFNRESVQLKLKMLGLDR